MHMKNAQKKWLFKQLKMEAYIPNLIEKVGDEKASMGNNKWISRGINRRKFVIMFMQV